MSGKLLSFREIYQRILDTKGISIKNFEEDCSQKRKYFKRIIENLNITKYFKDAKEYMIPETQIEALQNILDKATDSQMKKIRKNDISKVDTEFLMELIEDFNKILKDKLNEDDYTDYEYYISQKTNAILRGDHLRCWETLEKLYIDVRKSIYINENDDEDILHLVDIDRLFNYFIGCMSSTSNIFVNRVKAFRRLREKEKGCIIYQILFKFFDIYCDYMIDTYGNLSVTIDGKEIPFSEVFYSSFVSTLSNPAANDIIYYNSKKPEEIIQLVCKIETGEVKEEDISFELDDLKFPSIEFTEMNNRIMKETK